MSGSREQEILVSMVMYATKGVKITQYFRNNDFKSSNVFLKSFLSKHRIASNRIIEESKTFDERFFLNFKELHKSKLKEYEDRKVYKYAETEIFWRCSLKRTYTNF